jgi:hypothetical protein
MNWHSIMRLVAGTLLSCMLNRLCRAMYFIRTSFRLKLIVTGCRLPIEGGGFDDIVLAA